MRRGFRYVVETQGGRLLYVGSDEAEARRVSDACDDSHVRLERRDRSTEGGWRTWGSWSGDDWPV